MVVMDPASTFRTEPNLTVFYCDRCCGQSPTGTGVGAHCRLVPCCAGQVDGRLIQDAFTAGADGVLVLGCLGQACCAPLGELAALRQIHEGTLALHREVSAKVIRVDDFDPDLGTSLLEPANPVTRFPAAVMQPKQMAGEAERRAA